MKRWILFILIGMMMDICCPVIGQETNRWPPRTTGISLFGSTLARYINVVNLSFDRFSVWKNGLVGHTAGITSLSLGNIPGKRTNVAGVHFTLDLLAGLKNHHFEGKLGGVVTNKPIFGEFFMTRNDDRQIGFIPIFSVGYRFQKPTGGLFLRTALSSAGFGIGVGYAFKPKIAVDN